MKYRLNVADSGLLADTQEPEALDRVVRVFKETGFVLLEGAFPLAIVEGLHRAYLAQYGCMTPADMAAAAEKPGSRIFERGPDRHEVVIRMVQEFRDTNIYANPLMMPVLRRLLGDGLQLSAFVTVVAHPGSPQQHTHRDHGLLFPDDDVLCAMLPPQAIHVAVPLVDVDRQAGPTALWPGSHRWRLNRKTDGIDPIVPELRRGDCMLIDYRTIHCGMANVSHIARPILYMAYSRPWFFDRINHEKSTPLDLPVEDGEEVQEELKSLLSRAMALSEIRPARPRSDR